MKKVFPQALTKGDPFSKTLVTEVFWGEVWRGAFFQKRLSPQILFLKFYSFILGFFFAFPVFADMTLHVGPASSGGGGPNPVSIPPIQIVDYEFVWVTSQKREWSVSIVPGLFYGQRFMLSEGAYVSLGGGLVIDLNGVGPGLDAAFGYDACGSSLCFNIEFRKAFGLNFRNAMSPYALRVGVTLRTG